MEDNRAYTALASCEGSRTETALVQILALKCQKIRNEAQFWEIKRQFGLLDQKTGALRLLAVQTGCRCWVPFESNQVVSSSVSMYYFRLSESILGPFYISKGLRFMV